VGIEALKIVAEHRDEAAGDFGEFGLVSPSLDRFEEWITGLR